MKTSVLLINNYNKYSNVELAVSVNWLVHSVHEYLQQQRSLVMKSSSETTGLIDETSGTFKRMYQSHTTCCQVRISVGGASFDLLL